MGVLSCDRNNCENIMCDRYSHKYGYICLECFEELIMSGPETNIEKFINTKKTTASNQDATFARFNVEFPYNC